MLAILKFNLDNPDDKIVFETMQQATQMQIALEDIRQEVFRPARKHGYGRQDIQKLIDKIGPDATELISLLENVFNEIVIERDLDIF